MNRSFPPWWLTRGWRSWLVLDQSWLFRGLVTLRRKMYQRGWFKSSSLPIPVIVVGSILVGGTGKTPLILWLIEALQVRGWTPGVVSRGYGGTNKQARLLTAQDSVLQTGDEPLLIAQTGNVPVAIGPCRVAAAQLLLEKYPQLDVILSDDGLQHLAMARDVEIAVMDARGFGNGHMLPAGPLREPPCRLDSVTAVVLRDSTQTLATITPTFRMKLSIEHLRHVLSGEIISSAAFVARFKKRLAAAGIGYPKQFFERLKDAGINCAELSLPDHFDYAQSPFPADTDLAIVITEKDVLKTEHLQDNRLWVAHARTEVDPGLIALIEQTIEARRGPKTA